MENTLSLNFDTEDADDRDILDIAKTLSTLEDSPYYGLAVGEILKLVLIEHIGFYEES